MKAGKTAHKQRKQPVVQPLTFDERTAARKLGVSYITLFRRRHAGEAVYYRLGGKILYDDYCIQETLKRSRRPAVTV